MTDETTGRRTDLPKAYAPGDVETAIYERWLAADVFAPDGAGSRADPSKPPFVIVQPPPNVTGALHIGHALTADLEDVMVRRARMLGRPTLPPPGLDYASIGNVSSSTGSWPRRGSRAPVSAGSAISSGWRPSST